MKKQTISEKNIDIPRLRWREKAIVTSCSLVPHKSGVYVIGQVEYSRGLEISRKYLYIGETNNLNRRLEEHGPIKEPVKGFRSYLQKNLYSIRCWYSAVPANRRIEEQNFLIKKIRPQFNVQHNRGDVSHEQR